MEEILVEYRTKARLVPQDIIKCYLRMHQRANSVTYYDHRVKLWRIRPGDVVFVNGSFQPIVSYPRIDDTLKGVKCGHMEEKEESKKRVKVACECRKWYVYYKLDSGKIKRFHPSWDGLTCIPADKIRDVLEQFLQHRSLVQLRNHFTKNMLLKDDVHGMLSNIQNIMENPVTKTGKETSVSCDQHSRPPQFRRG